MKYEALVLRNRFSEIIITKRKREKMCSIHGQLSISEFEQTFCYL